MSNPRQYYDDHILEKITKEKAYQFGYDCGLNGSTLTTVTLQFLAIKKIRKSGSAGNRTQKKQRNQNEGAAYQASRTRSKLNSDMGKSSVAKDRRIAEQAWKAAEENRKSVVEFKERLKKKVMELMKANRDKAAAEYDGSEESNRECFHLDKIHQGMNKVLTLIDQTV